MKSLNEFINESYVGPESVNYKKPIKISGDDVYIEYKGTTEPLYDQPLATYPDWSSKQTKKFYKLVTKNIKGVELKEGTPYGMWKDLGGVYELWIEGEFEVVLENNNLMYLKRDGLEIRCSRHYLNKGDVTIHNDPAN